MARHEGDEAFPSRPETTREDQRTRFEMRDARLFAVCDMDRDAVDLPQVASVCVNELIVEQLAHE
jgi:hypothetical protein